MKRNWGKIRRFIPMYLMLLPGLYTYLSITICLWLELSLHSRNIITVWES